MKQKLLILFLVLNTFSTASNAQIIQLVKEINTNVNQGSNPKFFTVCNNKLFFVAADNSGATKLWVTTGTDATTQVLDFVSGAGIGNSITNLVAYNNNLYFAYDDGIHGTELWTSDGTVAGTVLFMDFNPGLPGSSPEALIVNNGKLFIDAVGSNGLYNLYATDGIIGVTTLIRNQILLVGGHGGIHPTLGTDLYFDSDNGTGTGNGLWKTDGSTTVMVKGNIIASEVPGMWAVMNNKIYLNVAEATAGTELWVTDGTTVGTQLVKNLMADGGGVFGNGDPKAMTVYNNKLYFSAQDDAHGRELFVSDGTDAGTQVVADIIPGTGSSLPNSIIVYNGFLYFATWATFELWKSDGTAAGTTLVKNTFVAVNLVTVWNGKMYISDGQGIIPLQESDGTAVGTKNAAVTNVSFQIDATYSPDQGYSFTQYNSDLYFSGRCFTITDGFEPVRLTLGTCTVQGATATSNSPLCSGTNLQLNATGGTSYAWTGPNSFTSTSQNPLINNATTAASGTYSVVVTNGACSSTLNVTVVVNQTPGAPDVGAQTFCSTSNPTVGSLPQGGATYKWYTALTGGSSLPLSTVLITQDYYVSQTQGTCEGSRTLVGVTVTQALTYYRDADGDTYGNAAISTLSCTVPIGYVLNNTDCNDNDAAIHPGAVEICDGKDNNCNGQIDEGVKTTYYRDADGDTYGNAAITIQACSLPAGYVTNNTDCNDNNSAVNPGATEICGNGIDDNCNGQIDENCPVIPLTISINDVSVHESQGIATLTVSLSKISTQAVKINYQTVDGTASSRSVRKAPADYVAARGSITIAAGSLTGTISITVINDGLAEPTEYFDVQLSFPKGTTGTGTFSKASGRITILDGTARATGTKVEKEISQEASIIQELKVSVSSNPTSLYFTINTESNNHQPLMVRVSDERGRLIEIRSNILPNSIWKIGNNYGNGFYFMEIIQGNVRKTIKLLKL